jgi:hypothetical protein
MEDTAEHYKNVRESIEFFTMRTAEKENEDPAGSSLLEDTAENSSHRGHSREFYCTDHSKNREPSRDLQMESTMKNKNSRETNVVNGKEYTFRRRQQELYTYRLQQTPYRDIQMRKEQRKDIVFPTHKGHGRELCTIFAHGGNSKRIL